MEAVFLVCLVAGLVATALLAAFGGAGSHVHLHAGPAHAHPQLGGHAHAAHPTAQVPASANHQAPLGTHGGHGTQQPAAHGLPAPASTQEHATAATQMGSITGAALSWSLSWLSPLTIAAGALGFGAAGLLATQVAQSWAVPVAVVGAVLGAAFVRALLAAFVRAETPALQAGADGAIGMLNAPIRPDAAGEVVYTLEGLHRSAPARTLDGAPLPRGTRVVIVRREQGMAWVEPLDPLTALPDGATAHPQDGLPADTMAGAERAAGGERPGR